MSTLINDNVNAVAKALTGRDYAKSWSTRLLRFTKTHREESQWMRCLFWRYWAWLLGGSTNVARGSAASKPTASVFGVVVVVGAVVGTDDRVWFLSRNHGY
jgi:hypothetical protein